MKKASAFSVFKSSKKEEGTTPKVELNNSRSHSVKKASSTPAINELEKKSKKILKAFSGSFRGTIRGEKHRPKTKEDSPFVAGDTGQVKLTGIKQNKAKERESGSKKEKQKVLAASAAAKQLGKKQKKPSFTLPLNELPSTDDDNTTLATKHVSENETPKLPARQDSSSKKASKRQLDHSTVPKNKRPRLQEETPHVHQVRIKDGSSPMKVASPFSTPRGASLEYMYDSSVEAVRLFECMIHPVQAEKFFRDLWQKKPLLVRRHIETYNDGWFSTKELDRILKQERIEFGVNLDVTTYKDGKRETHNPVGRAYAPVVWDFYQTGCSVRLMNPQTYSKEVWNMLSVLQEYFSCCAGANVYLTPPGTQGFAPHYDDIEAFILQLEGKKHWKLYNPRTESEVLPRVSSPNFTESDIGEPILDVTLHAGDLLYMPRGIIHQGHTSEDAHSLHITMSCYQKNTWGDLLEKLVPQALQIAIEEDVEFRQGLPRDYLSYMGIVHSDKSTPGRQGFLSKISNLMGKIVEKYCPVDAACDQMGKQFLHDSLPPVLTEGEKRCCIQGHGETWDTKNHCVLGTTEIEPDVEIKIIRKGAIRLVTEEDAVRIYHSLENERLYHGKDPQFIEISAEAAPAVEYLIHSYPEFVSVDSLPYCSVTEKVEIASILYDKGLLVTKEPLDLNLDDHDDPESDGH